MSGTLLGTGLALLSASCFACGQVCISKSAVKVGDDRGVILSVIFTAAIAGLVWLLMEAGRATAADSPVTMFGLAMFALSGVFSVALGRKFLYVSIQQLGVTRASAVKRLNPFFSVLLAFIFLHEAITGFDGIGMVLVALAFGILIRQSFMKHKADANSSEPPPYHYIWGVASSLSYATSYIFRKQGLDAIAAPAFGTMISALAALAFFMLIALFIPRRRSDFGAVFTGVDRWMVAAGILISFGQILFFAALAVESISTVVMVSSLEVFVAAFLSIVVFRTEKRPDAVVLLAALFATLGVVAVAAG
jgi:drug/metabolite transporter (DMT)-like permease